MPRSLELILLALAAPLLLLLMGGVACLVLAGMGRPVFFRQVRPGLGGQPFNLVKFRTMREGPAPDAARLTPLGRWLRRTSLDELPELLNVLRGDMALVGPRPLLLEYLPRYTRTQARRHDVRPGITGWAQIHGRNTLTWEQKFEHDVWYVEHRSLMLDLRILGRTVSQVLCGSGVSAEGHATMPEFTGEPVASGHEQGDGGDLPRVRKD